MLHVCLFLFSLCLLSFTRIPPSASLQAQSEECQVSFLMCIDILVLLVYSLYDAHTGGACVCAVPVQQRSEVTALTPQGEVGAVLKDNADIMIFYKSDTGSSRSLTCLL